MSRIKKKKSGIVTIIVAALAIIGYLIYHYGYMVYQEYDYYTYYEDIHGLKRSNPVFIDGVRVGEVSGILINKKGKVQVTMSIHKENKIPKGSVALLASSGLLGDKMIQIQPTRSPEFYNHEGTLRGMYDTSILEMSDQIEPIIESAKYILETADRSFSRFNNKLDNGWVEKTEKDVNALEQDMGKYRQQAASIQKSVRGVMQSVRSFRKQTDEMVANREELNNTLKNAEASTADLSDAPVVNSLKEAGDAAIELTKAAEDVVAAPIVTDALDDDKTYKETTETLGELNNKLQQTKKDPPVMSLIGGD